MEEVKGKGNIFIDRYGITYRRTGEGFCYLTMITNEYSREIVWYNTSKRLRNEGVIKALKIAIKNRKTKEELIHHSDRDYNPINCKIR